MKISADFDSGNIQVIDASDPQRVLLAMRPDLNSHHFQWFHFQVDGLQPGQRHAFSLTNAGQSAYNNAWDGYQAVASYDRQDWFRVPTRFADGQLHFELQAERAQAWFAYFEPYSRARHDALIEQALSQAGAELLACGKSLEGRDIQLLHIARQAQTPRKLWIIAQQHPGEHMAEWFMEGLIERLQDPQDAELNALLAQAELYLVPNMNPDAPFAATCAPTMRGRTSTAPGSRPAPSAARKCCSCCNTCSVSASTCSSISTATRKSPMCSAPAARATPVTVHGWPRWKRTFAAVWWVSAPSFRPVSATRVTSRARPI